MKKKVKRPNFKHNNVKTKKGSKIGQTSTCTKLQTHHKRPTTTNKEDGPPKKKLYSVPVPLDDSSDDDTPIKQLRKSFGITNVAIDTDDSTDDQSENHDHVENQTQIEESDYDGDSNSENEEELPCEEEQSDNNFSDPFDKHFQRILHPNFLKNVENRSAKNSFINWDKLGKIGSVIPISPEEPSPVLKALLDEPINYIEGTEIPKIYANETPEAMHIKTQLIRNLKQSNVFLDDETDSFMTPFQKELFSILNNYHDLQFAETTYKNHQEIRYTYCLHILNHILKTRGKVVNHNAKIKAKNSADVLDNYQDQGFVRPKVLILVPFKASAVKIVTLFENLLAGGKKGTLMNKKRFLDEYSGNEISMPKKNPKPEDFEYTFSGNTSDDFKIGMAVTKNCLKLYTNFYSSDIILASPLALRTLIGANGEANRDYDFLTSIEILLIDQAEIILMQNWDHVLHIFEHLHLTLSKNRDTDFSRVRMWSLDGHAKFYRQNLLFSSISPPEFFSLFMRNCHNFAGYLRVWNPVERGMIAKVFVEVLHKFHRFESSTPVDAIDGRFQYFLKEILPHSMQIQSKRTLIYIPSYFDFVKIRNYFKKEVASFTQICEYTKSPKVAKARDNFFHGQAQFLLYSERFHFYNRIRLKGIRNIIFYGLPTFPHFYPELCNLMNVKSLSSVNVLYCKFDANHLIPLLGTDKAMSMLQDASHIHMLTTAR